MSAATGTLRRAGALLGGLAALALVAGCGPQTTESDVTARVGRACDTGLGGDGYACDASHETLLECGPRNALGFGDGPSTWREVCVCNGSCRVTETRTSGGFGPDRVSRERQCSCVGGSAGQTRSNPGLARR